MYLAPIGIESVPYLPLSALINLRVPFIFYNTLLLAEEFSYQVQCGWLPTCACKHSHTSALIFMLHLFAYLCPSQTLQQWSMPPEARKSPLQCQLQPHTEDKEPSVHMPYGSRSNDLVIWRNLQFVIQLFSFLVTRFTHFYIQSKGQTIGQSHSQLSYTIISYSKQWYLAAGVQRMWGNTALWRSPTPSHYHPLRQSPAVDHCVCITLNEPHLPETREAPRYYTDTSQCVQLCLQYWSLLTLDGSQHQPASLNDPPQSSANHHYSMWRSTHARMLMATPLNPVPVSHLSNILLH